MNNIQVPPFGSELNPRSKHRKVKIVIESISNHNFMQYSFNWDTFQILASTPNANSCMSCDCLREIIEMYKAGLQLPIIIADRNLILRNDEKIASKCWVTNNYRFSVKMIK